MAMSHKYMYMEAMKKNNGEKVFQKLEYEEEVAGYLHLKKLLDDGRSNFTEILLNSHSSELEDFNHTLHTALEKLVTTLEQVRSNGLSLLVKDEETVVQSASWGDFEKSAFFASTVLTTIGYGDMAPETPWGRGFCILFALIGIPFTLTVIADVGKLMAALVSMSAKRLKKSLPKKTPSGTKSKCCSSGKSATVAAAVLSLLLYILFGGYLFTLWESWDLFNSFYFCFITMTTIGLGDLVPENTSYIILCVYIMIGLAMTSTAIELVRIQYADSWRRMRELSMRLGPLAETLKKYGDNINLDVSVLQDLKELKKVLAMSSGKQRREGSIWKKFWENEDGYDDEPDSNEPRLIQIIIYESSV
ncbi:unnamed protein product [Allacma fusca]|uniref:Potassium channel domain-containing protein n=1 Tax=Allacma fusca TaxID=39272 RepID=A0A8J2J629_9HEXA|nr:unnamed protein product [Allacma fusca]